MWCVVGASMSTMFLGWGNVFSWGKGKDGELGKGSSDEVIIALQSETLINKKVWLLSTKSQHTLAITKDGTAWSWGEL